RAPVVPDDRGHEVVLVVVEHEDRAALAGEPDRLVRRVGQRRGAHRDPRRGTDAVPHLLGVLLDPPGPGGRTGVLLVALSQPVAVLVEDHDLAAGRPGVDSDECLRGAHAYTSLFAGTSLTGAENGFG